MTLGTPYAKSCVHILLLRQGGKRQFSRSTYCKYIFGSKFVSTITFVAYRNNYNKIIYAIHLKFQCKAESGNTSDSSHNYTLSEGESSALNRASSALLISSVFKSLSAIVSAAT